MNKNMQEWANGIIRSEERKNLPVLFFPCLKNIGTGVIEAVQDGGKMAEAMAEVIREYPETIAAITGMDLTVDSEAFGAAVKFSKRQAPAVREPVIKDVSDIDGLEIPAADAGRQSVVLEAVRKALNDSDIGDRPVFGGMLGPFSLAANLMEVSQALMLTRREPEKMELLLEKAVQFLINRAKGFKEAGADGVFIAEPTAGLLSPEDCERFSSVYVKRIAEAVQDDGFFLILHNCGNVLKSVGSMCGTGCKGLHFGNNVDMRDVLAQAPGDILVFGNIDPSADFFLGTPEKVYESTMTLLKRTAEYPNFVLSSGCDLAPMVSNENIEAYYRACRDYNNENAAEKM